MGQLLDHGKDVGAGWYKVLLDLHDKLLLADPNYNVAQVKEKFGVLRVYLDYETPRIWQLLSDAEDRSSRVCEVCGSRANTIRTTLGWWLTRCATHDPNKEAR